MKCEMSKLHKRPLFVNTTGEKDITKKPVFLPIIFKNAFFY